jgi:hypothetical protein
LAALILVFDLATIFFACAAQTTLEASGGLTTFREAVETGLPLTAFLGTRLAAIFLWPPFAAAAAVRRVRRADLAGLPLPAARKIILSRRFNNRWFAKPLSIIGGFADLIALVMTLAVLATLASPRT